MLRRERRAIPAKASLVRPASARYNGIILKTKARHDGRGVRLEPRHSDRSPFLVLDARAGLWKNFPCRTLCPAILEIAFPRKQDATWLALTLNATVFNGRPLLQRMRGIFP